MEAGVLPPDVVLTFGCATDEPATRLLRVDARGDRLVEVDARGRTVRTVDVADVVSFEARAKDDDEDRWDFVDEYARWLDEDDVREWRNTVLVDVASASGRHRKRDDDDDDDDENDDGRERGEGTAVVTVEYRMRCENDSRALGHAMRRLSRGAWNPDLDDDRLPESLASLDAQNLNLRRPPAQKPPPQRPGAPERAVRCGGGWSKRIAVITAGGRLFLMEECDVDGVRNATCTVYGANVRVTDAVSLDETSIATVRRGAAPGEFDVCTGDGRVRLALAALDSDPRGAEGWIDALREARESRRRGKYSRGLLSPGIRRGTRRARTDSRRLGTRTSTRGRGAGAGTSAARGGTRRGDARGARGRDEDGHRAEPRGGASRKPGRVGSGSASSGRREGRRREGRRRGRVGARPILALGGARPDGALPVQFHRRRRAGPRGRKETRSANLRTNNWITLRVDVERNAIEGYAARRCRSTGELRQTLVRVLDATDAATTTPEGPRGRVLRLVSRGFRSTPAGTELGRFEFQSAADAVVFESLLRDVRSGAYRSAERYQARTVLKRGSEDVGVSSSVNDGERRR